MTTESFLAVANTIPLGLTVKSASHFTTTGLGEEQQQRVPTNVCPVTATDGHRSVTLILSYTVLRAMVATAQAALATLLGLTVRGVGRISTVLEVRRDVSHVTATLLAPSAHSVTTMDGAAVNLV